MYFQTALTLPHCSSIFLQKQIQSFVCFSNRRFAVRLKIKLTEKFKNINLITCTMEYVFGESVVPVQERKQIITMSPPNKKLHSHE